MKNYYIDIHCHSTAKPFGKSVASAYRNIADPLYPNSIWFYSPASEGDIQLNKSWGLTAFNQGDFTSLAKGNVRVVCVPFGPLEQGFVTIRKKGTYNFKQDWGFIGPFARKVANNVKLLFLFFDFVTGMGNAKLEEMRKRNNNSNYFHELDLEYKYLQRITEQPIFIHGSPDKQPWTYFIAKDFNHLDEVLKNNSHAIGVIPTIEGAYAFGSNLDTTKMSLKDSEKKQIIDSVNKVKNWESPPLFITFACHFNNQLCGHAASCPKYLKLFLDFLSGQDRDFTKFGEEIVRLLLDEKEGKRILIDIKHMSWKSRKTYISILDEYNKKKNREGKYDRYKRFEERIPIIVSHGCVTGTSHRKKKWYQSKKTNFITKDINIYDEEIKEIFRTGGLLGIQLDERVIAKKKNKSNKKKLRKLRRILKNLNPNILGYDTMKKDLEERICQARAEPVWNQLQHIAKVLDGTHEEDYAKGQTCWDIACLGTDYDGHIDPINDYWGTEQMELLEKDLISIASNRLKEWTLSKKQNKLPAEEIVTKFMHSNTNDFLRRNF